MISYTYNLDLTPGGALLFVPLKQYEDSAQIEFKLFTRIGNFSLPNDTKVYVRGTKEDGNGFSYDEVSGKVKLNVKKDAVILSIDKQMTAIKGKVFCEFVFKNANGKELITASFALKVYRSALDEDTILSESVIKEIKDAIIDAYIDSNNLYLINNDNVILGPYPLNSIQIVETPSDLDEDAIIGSVAVVLSKSKKEIEVPMPKQILDEEVQEELSYRSFKIGNAVFNESGVMSLIRRGPDHFKSECGLFYDNSEMIGLGLIPCVSNIDDNIFIEEGEFSKEVLLRNSVIVADGITKCYAINLSIDFDFENVKPEAIIRIDDTHISIPIGFVYAFENVDDLLIMSGSPEEIYQLGPFDVKEGYNAARYILDESTGEIDESSMYMTQEDPNDCYFIDPKEDVQEVVMYVEGQSASSIYKGIFHSFSVVNRGLFIKYEDGWSPVDSGLVEEIEEKVEELEEDVSNLHSTTSSLQYDVSNLKAKSHWHGNKDLLDKFTEASGKLLFDGSEVGGIQTAQHPSDLAPEAQDGSVAVAVNDDKGIVYPEQISDEEVTVDVSGKSIHVGSPSFDSAAIGAAISAQDLPTATVEVSGEGNLSAIIVPVVADINNNDYTNAGMTLDPSQVVIATCTKNYSIGLMLVPNLVNPDKIIPVDASHVKLPFMAILAYENLSGTVYSLPNESLTEGWNIALATVDTATYSDITGIEIVTGIDINEYVSLKISDNNEMTIEGTSGVDIFHNIIIGNDGDSKGLYVKLGTWKRALLDEATVDDVTLLGITAYENLVIRDDVLTDSIQDVPVFAGGDISLGGQLIRIADASENYIALCDIDDADGLPVKYIKTNFNETIKVWFPIATSPVSSVVSYPQGWSEGGVSTTAPSFAGFTPTHIEYKNTSYTDVSTLPAEVKSALRSLSQCINVSKEAMGSISVPEDSVVRFNGKIEPNRKYYFNTIMDFALDLPTVPFEEEDEQFAIYLKTGSVVDMTLPSDVLVSGEIDTSGGNHKVIGCYDKTVSKWCIGCVDYEVVE